MLFHFVEIASTFFPLCITIDGEQLEDGQVQTALKTTLPFEEITWTGPEEAAHSMASDSLEGQPERKEEAVVQKCFLLWS